MTQEPSPWNVYDYEVEMFKQTWSVSKTGNRIFQQVMVNAVTESLLLHVRILTQILTSQGFPDDIKLKDLMPEFESQRVAELKAKYGDGKTEGTPCWILNKKLAHASRTRSSSHDYRPVLDKLAPCIESLLKEIDLARDPSTRTR